LTEQRVILLICSELEREKLDATGLAAWAETTLNGVRVALVPALCHGWSRLEPAIRKIGGNANAVVAVTCHYWQWDGEAQHYARRAGLSPLALQVVPLASICQGDFDPHAKARAVLAGAVARALAFAGATPDHLKPILMGLGQRVSRRALLSLPHVTYTPIPSVAPTRCVAWSGCRVCVTVCPHGALAWNGHQIVLDRDRCTSCGRCLVACPRAALEMPGWSSQEISAQLAATVDLGDGRPVAYVCPNAPPPSGPWLPLWVRCAAQVSLAALLWPLVGGASAVAVGHCGAPCRSGQRQAVESVVKGCQQLMVALSLEPDRVRLDEPGELANGPPPPPPLTREAKLPSPLPLWGAGTDALAISALADMVGACDAEVAHPGLPLGHVMVDEGTCTRCGTCASVCPSGALAYDEVQEEVRLTFDTSLCVACGNCLRSCPERQRGAIAMERRVSLAAVRAGRRELARDSLFRCRRCGGAVATAAMVDRLAAMLEGQFRPEVMRDLCSDCRGLP
jgi:ferredoxin